MADETITIRRPDDFHLHLRDGGMLSAVAPQSHHFARAVAMPNLVPPVASAEMVRDYRARIEAAGGPEPLMTLYLTDDTTPEMIDAAAGGCVAAKLYPAHATTNSAHGVHDVAALTDTFARMGERGMLLLVHGEVTDPEVDIFDREAVFLDRVLEPLRQSVPGLKIVLEHVSSAVGVEFVRGFEDVAGTITAHHLVIDRNDLLVGGIKPHNYCLPIVKRASDRRSLVRAAISGDGRFFFGSDSAPHADPRKLGPCGAAGCFTAPVALAVLAGVFAEEGALDRLEPFTSAAGAVFYGLAPNEGTLTLSRCAPYRLPPVPTDEGPVEVFSPPGGLTWRVEG